MLSVENEKILGQILKKISEYVKGSNFTDSNLNYDSQKEVIFAGVTTLLVARNIMKKDDIEGWYENYVKKEYSNDIDKCVNTILTYRELTNNIYQGFLFFADSEIQSDGIDTLFVGLEIMKIIAPEQNKNNAYGQNVKEDISFLIDIIMERIQADPSLLYGIFSIDVLLKECIEFWHRNVNHGFSDNFDHTFYDVLEVSEKASKEVIDMAYKALCKKYHPDIYKGDTNYANQKMCEINEAYSVLSNETKRKEYDAKLQISHARPRNEASHAAAVNMDAYSKETNSAQDNLCESDKKEKSGKHGKILVMIIVILIISSLALLFIEGGSSNKSQEPSNKSDSNDTDPVVSGQNYELGEAESWDEFDTELQLFLEMIELYGYDQNEVISKLEKKGYDVEKGRPLIQSFICEYFGARPYAEVKGTYDEYGGCYVESFSDYERMYLSLMYAVYDEMGIEELRSMQRN